MSQAQWLYSQGASYALSMYVAGLAVECMLRAFKLKKSSVLDERHDLLRLFKASGMLEMGVAAQRHPGLTESEAVGLERGLRGSMNDICTLWANDFRFASEDRLRLHLRKNVVLRKGLKGDILKACAFDS